MNVIQFHAVEGSTEVLHAYIGTELDCCLQILGRRFFGRVGELLDNLDEGLDLVLGTVTRDRNILPIMLPFADAVSCLVALDIADKHNLIQREARRAQSFSGEP